jgi:hypothetical protein
MNNLTIDSEQVKTFFNTLWPDQEHGFLSISSDNSPVGLSSKFFSHPLKMDLLINAIQRWSARNVWFTIGLFGKRPDKGRGRASDVAASPGFVSDIDCRGGVHNEKNLPTREEALNLINEFPFKASLLIWSGGGFQVYHLFDDPWIFETEDQLEKAKDLSRRWQKFILSRGKEKGWKLDSVGSVEHLFRVPGTYNHKGSPVPVEILEVNNEQRF